jgi:hypothetical protein
MELKERGKGKENDRTSVILHTRCEGREYKDVYRKLLKMGGRGRGVRESNERS